MEEVMAYRAWKMRETEDKHLETDSGKARHVCAGIAYFCSKNYCKKFFVKIAGILKREIRR